MGLHSGGLIVGRIFASEIWGALIFSGGLIFGGAYYRNFTVFTFEGKTVFPFYSSVDKM